MRNNGFNKIACMVVINTKPRINTSYMCKAIIVPSIYKEQYAQTSKTIRILGCTANKRKRNDKTIGSKPMISFNSFHLYDNIAEI